MLQIQRYEERGDAPAQAILQANSQARAIRKAIETQEELERIKERVVRVCFVLFFYFIAFVDNCEPLLNVFFYFIFSRRWIRMI